MPAFLEHSIYEKKNSQRLDGELIKLGSRRLSNLASVIRQKYLFDNFTLSYLTDEVKILKSEFLKKSLI